MITVRGKEYDFSFMNADHVQRWAQVRAEIAERNKDISNFNFAKLELQEYADMLRTACMAITDLVDGVFGDGTSNELLGPTTDFRAVIGMYQDFEDAIAADVSTFDKEMKQRYVPDTGKKKK